MNEQMLALPAPEQPKLLTGPPAPAAHDPDPRAGRRRLVRIAIVVAVLLLLLSIGWFFHHRQASQAQAANEKARDRLPSVGVIDVKTSSPTSDLRLPGTITPITEASLFARSSGYVTVRYVDIGDTVHRGQVLAQIESPDLDQQVEMARQQLDQAKSAVNDAKARVDLSRVTLDRLDTLVKDQAVSQQQVDQGRQDLDTARAGAASSAANVGAAQANLRRLVVLQGYEKLRAPFDGIVTSRNVDVGALVNGAGANAGMDANANSSSVAASGASGSSAGGGGVATQNSQGSASTELFRIAQDDRVRVFVTVPQENAAAVEANSEANVFVEGFDAPFVGRVTRTARSLDPAARTLLTEVQVPNPQHRLVPGMYAQVGFRSPRRGAPLLVPGEAVVARAGGLSVAVLEELRPEDRERVSKAERSAPKKDDPTSAGAKDGAQEDRPDTDPQHARRVHLQKVDVGRDYGTEIEITRGLKAGMSIVANPGDDVAEGALVIPHAQKDGSGGKETDAPPPGNRSPSMEAPTKGRK